jgi:hypothetical protein
MSTIRSFFVGVTRIALIIVIAIVALSAAGWGVYEFSQARERSRNAPLATLRKWPAVRIEALGAIELNLSTIWRDGRLFYQFSVGGYPAELASVRDADSRSANAAWTLSFLDENGFKVFEHQVPLNAMAKVIDSSGNGTGLNSNGDTYVSAEDYRRATAWEVTWNFSAPRRTAPASRPVPEVGASPSPRPPSTPQWRNVSLWRGLSRGMSKGQVREILGEPGKVVESGIISIWYYGYPLGGEVTFDSSGNVNSWREP